MELPGLYLLGYLGEAEIGCDEEEEVGSGSSSR